MLAHPDDFMPFLPSISGEDGTGATDDGIMTPEQFEIYCRRIAETGEWGGEPEIQALSRSFGVPIHVVQSGTPRIVVHEPVEAPKGIKPVMISYHRRMYGLGEVSCSLKQEYIS
jgi:OTU domain-containing protein 6